MFFFCYLSIFTKSTTFSNKQKTFMYFRVQEQKKNYDCSMLIFLFFMMSSQNIFAFHGKYAKKKLFVKFRSSCSWTLYIFGTTKKKPRHKCYDIYLVKSSVTCYENNPKIEILFNDVKTTIIYENFKHFFLFVFSFLSIHSKWQMMLNNFFLLLFLHSPWSFVFFYVYDNDAFYSLY